MIAAVIPTRYRPPELTTLLDVLRQDEVKPIVVDSDLHGHRIYRMWNAGVELARGASAIAVLNDDITILPGTLPMMAEALHSRPSVGVVYPDVNAPWQLPSAWSLVATQGTWGAGGMTGFCFMFRPELPVTFDESYHWWYGDDQFEADVRALGYEVCRVLGVPIRHAANGSASKDWDRLAPLIEQDRARWEAAA